MRWHFFRASDDHLPTRFILPRASFWTETAFAVGTDWCKEQFGPAGERWYRITWMLCIPDPTDAAAFRLRFC